MFGDVEHRFGDRQLDETRARLYRAADTLLEAEGHHAFVHPTLANRRYVGISEFEIDADPSLYDRFEQRRTTLPLAAGEVVEAYDALIALARRRGHVIARPMATAGTTP